MSTNIAKYSHLANDAIAARYRAAVEVRDAYRSAPTALSDSIRSAADAMSRTDEKVYFTDAELEL